MSTERSAVRINYKSGRSVDVTAKSFRVRRAVMNGAMTVEWEGVTPVPLTLGVDEIESIWDLGPVKRGWFSR